MSEIIVTISRPKNIKPETMKALMTMMECAAKQFFNEEKKTMKRERLKVTISDRHIGACSIQTESGSHIPAHQIELVLNGHDRKPVLRFEIALTECDVTFVQTRKTEVQNENS